MKRDDVIETLRAHAPELRAAGLLHTAVCGSYARGTAIHGTSDVDILADFDKTRLSLIDLVGIEQRIEKWLGAEVDLLDRDMLPARVRQRVEAEAMRAF